MDKKKLSNINLKGVLGKLPPSIRSPFHTWSASPEGWGTNLAFNPIDQLLLYPGDPITWLKDFCDRHKGNFLCGYLCFEAGYQFLGITTGEPHKQVAPIIRFNAYDSFARFDANNATCYYHNPEFVDLIAGIGNTKTVENPETAPSSLHFKASLDETAYHTNFKRITDYIRGGDIYQINYTHLLQAETSLTGRELFQKLAAANPVDYAAYWETDELNIISLSPESFVQIQGDTIITQPIKGTRPRGSTLEEDRRLQGELLSSRKEEAELFMITDLLRNDVGKVSRVGSVKVVHRKKLQQLAKVFHTYARIEGRRLPDLSNMDVLLSMFPGGSISGCPKKRAVEIIDELEDKPRGIYTGCVGYILPSGDMAFNIAIRTVVQKGTSLTLGVGGGITIESDPAEEYLETFAKASSFNNAQKTTE